MMKSAIAPRRAFSGSNNGSSSMMMGQRRHNQNGAAANGGSGRVMSNGDGGRSSSSTSSSTSRLLPKTISSQQSLLLLVVLVVSWFAFAVLYSVSSLTHTQQQEERQQTQQQHETLLQRLRKQNPQPEVVGSSSPSSSWQLPHAFETVLERARHKRRYCGDLENKKNGAGDGDISEGGGGEDTEATTTVRVGNETIASLPPFGIITALERWKTKNGAAAAAATDADARKWQCVLPPENECTETQLTVIFMGYNPDRVGKTLGQIQKMLDPAQFHGLVHEIILVWNGERAISESDDGKKLLAFEAASEQFRITYPLKMGFPNDLMNRYHPDVVGTVNTRAIMYYDDDGPFYSYAATQGGFELWKRHASSQIGAMSRQLDYSPRQRAERHALAPEPAEHLFISHCTNVEDHVEYNFHFFANFDANMVLPSGSMLHVNYLCFLWHPVLEPIRNFVRAHPVHPDDATVSTLVSHLSGRAPRVYSRRLNPPEQQQQQEELAGATKTEAQRSRRLLGSDVGVEREWHYSEQHRALNTIGMGGVNWDDKKTASKMTDAKRYWAELRAIAVNALVQYFGSINSGSIGWCSGTQYYNPKADGRCTPVMAKQGWLPWMNPDGGTPRDTCP